MASHGSRNNRSLRFYPGLVAFTDAIDALPQETIRHFTLLREVDAKACGPEELLRRYINHAARLPPPINPSGPDGGLDHLRLREQLRRLREEALLKGEIPPPEDPTEDEDQPQEHSRRSRLHQARMLISDLLLTLDEKIHVISTASEALNKHIARLDDAYDHVRNEIDPVIRDGNHTHWAYKNSLVLRNVSPGQHRQNKTLAFDTYPTENAPLHATITTSRTDARRDAASRRHAPVPDIPDARNTSYNGANPLVPVPTSTHDLPSQPPAPKRRKAASQPSQPMMTASHQERPTVSGRPNNQSFMVQPIVNFSSSATVKKGGIAAGNGTNSATANLNSANKPPANRKRPLVPSASNASSPVRQSFPDLQVMSMASTAVGSDDTNTLLVTTTAQKPSAARNPRARPPISSKGETPKIPAKGNADVKAEERVQPSSVLAIGKGVAHGHGKPQVDPMEKANLGVKEVGNEKPILSKSQGVSGTSIVRHTSKDDKLAMRPSASISTTEKIQRSQQGSEEQPQESHHSRGGSISSTRTAQRAVSTTDSSKGTQSVKRKGLNSQVAKSSRANNATEDPGMANDDQNGGDQDDEQDEMRYCYCNQVSYGKMVACDGPNCQREWFHLPCVGLTHMPSTKDKWFCSDCRQELASHSKQNKALSAK